jgi:aminoglycoside phosphotransferase (APT) family kinase protein
MTESERAGEIVGRLRALGLARPDEAPSCTPLEGGVSSDIWRVDLETGPVCVKRALGRLKVARDWFAPVERSLNEARWLEFAHYAVPGSAPRIRAIDEAAKLFVMDYLDPQTHTLWKTELLAQRTDVAFAEAVGTRLGALHQAAAARPELAEQFATDDLFRAIRLDPYLAGAAERHADLEEALHALIEDTARVKLTLVHGDVSPKNILAGPDGPVFLDAECAWWGDPAFDLAFVLNHLLLKCLAAPLETAGYLFAFTRLRLKYGAFVTWESRFALEARAARLLPALLLARIDGKSPVEYVTQPGQKRIARTFARQFIVARVGDLAAIGKTWQDAMFQWIKAGMK